MKHFYFKQNLRYFNYAYKLLTLILVLQLNLLASVSAQKMGDYRSKISGKWTATHIWEVFNGTDWVAATTLPGVASNVSKVTVNESTIVSFTLDIVQYKIDTLDLYGRLAIADVGQPLHLNVGVVRIFPDSSKPGQLKNGGVINWDNNGSGLRIPYNASIGYPSNYKGIEALNAARANNCGDNIGLYLGGGSFGLPEVLYATCKGPLEGVCLSFEAVNEAGGTIRTVPVLPVPTIAGEGTESCELEFETTMTVLGVPKDAVLTASVYGENGSNTVTSVPASINSITDGGPLDLDQTINGAVTFALKLVASAPGKYPLVLTISNISPSACQNFGLVRTDTVDFHFIAPPTLSVSVPTSTCGGQFATAQLMNTSTENYIGVFWSVNNVAQTPVVVPPSTTMPLSIPTAGSGTTKLTINQFSYAAPSPIFSCANQLNTDYLINVISGSSLAIDQDYNSQQVFGGVDLTTPQGCRLIASLVSPQISTVEAKAFVGNGAVTIDGKSIVGRRVWMEPVTGTSTVYDKVTLYALNSEFAAFNASVASQMLPVDPNDPQNYKVNLRIYRFDEGEYDPATGLPTVPISQATLIDPATVDIKWSLSNGYWEITFPSTPLGLFVIANENFIILPIRLLSFDATLNGKSNVDLTWKTTEEREVSGFDIEVSATGTEFKKIGFVEARNTGTEQHYSFGTIMPSNLGYFRLKMIDKNGAVKYSPVRMLKSTVNIVKAYPNPASGYLNLDLRGYPAGQLRFIDMSGRVVMATRTTEGMNKVNTENLSNGIYLLEVKVGKETELVKISVQH